MAQAADHLARDGATDSTTREPRGEPLDSTLEERQSHDQTPIFRAVIGVYQKRSADLSDHERNLLLRLLGQISGNVDLALRQETALRLADNPRADHALVRLMLNDHIEVSRPLLERSEILTSSDLLRMISSRTTEFHLVIATRHHLPAEVSAALVGTGEIKVIKALLDNDSARISRSTFAAIATAARRNPELRAPLQSRPDTPRDLAAELLAEAAIDTEHAAAALANKLHRAGQLRVSVLVGALRERQVALFEHAFALLTGLPAAAMRQLLRDPSGLPLALAARAARMDRSAFSTVFVNYCEARGVSPHLDSSDFDRAMNVFRNLPQEGARAELHRLAT